MPELSVLLPARNAAGTITRAVASTLAAMPRDAELVVGNDSSSDSTVGEAIRGASRGGVVDPRLRIEDITPGEGGVSRVLTQLMERTDSRLVGRMDADDVSLKGRFKRTMRAIERGDDMVFTQMIELRGSRPVPRMPYEITPEDMGWHLLLTNPVCHPTMLATREIMDRVGGYRAVPAEDYDLWMRVASAGGRIRRIAPWGLLYRIHPGQVTGNASWRSDSWKNPEQAQAFAELSVSLTGQELPRLVSLVSLPRDEAERELDRFVQVYTQGVASRPATSRRALERRLNARAARGRPADPSSRAGTPLDLDRCGDRGRPGRRCRSRLCCPFVALGGRVDDRDVSVPDAGSRRARLPVEHDGHGDRAGHREVRRRPRRRCRAPRQRCHC